MRRVDPTFSAAVGTHVPILKTFVLIFKAKPSRIASSDVDKPTNAMEDTAIFKHKSSITTYSVSINILNNTCNTEYIEPPTNSGVSASW